MNRDNRKENNGDWKMEGRGSETGMEVLVRWGMTARKSQQSSGMGLVWTTKDS